MARATLSNAAVKALSRRRAKYAVVVVRHADGSRSQLRVPTRSMNAMVEVEQGTKAEAGRVNA